MTKTDTMAKLPGLFQRGGVWTLRVMIPLDLRGAYAGATKVVESLRTSNHASAKLAATSRRAELLEEFEQKRRTLSLTRIDRITPESARDLAKRVEARLLSVDDKLRDQPAAARLLLQVSGPARASKLRIGAPAPTPAVLDMEPALGPFDGLPEALAAELAAANQNMDAYAGQLMARRHLAAVLPLAQAEAQKLGWTFDATTPGAREALLEALKAYRKAFQAIGQRDQGEVIETPATPNSAPAASPARPVKLRDVFPQWQASKARKPATVKAAEKALSLYEEATGDPPIATLTRAQGVDMRAFLLAGGVTAKTARDRFDYIKGFLNFAHHELELIPKNPWAKLAIEYTTTTPRRPWSGEQLATYFARPLHTAYEVPMRWDAGADAAYWVPLLGIYTGARISELCQLLVADVETIDGIPVLRITDEAEDQSVKTQAARRTVPIHSELVRLGFLEYAQALRQAGARRLFPALTLHKTKPGTYFSGWFSEWRTLEDGSKLPDFHSLRHTVRSKLASARNEEPTIDTLIGHEIKGSQGARTYTHIDLPDLQRAIESISYPGMMLPRVYTRPRATEAKAAK